MAFASGSGKGAMESYWSVVQRMRRVLEMNGGDG